MKIFISGLVNVETNVRVGKFPIEYAPVHYPFFGIESNVSGVAFNVAKALKTLGNDVLLNTVTGNDEAAERISAALKSLDIASKIETALNATPLSVVLYDDTGKRQIYCDLKDIQERTADVSAIAPLLEGCAAAVLCNINFNRPLLRIAKDAGVPIATDVHALSDPDDAYNRDFMEAADILFLSDERLPEPPERFISRLSEKYAAKIIVTGCGKAGACLYCRDDNLIYRMTAARVGTVVNTVGAGDALFSAFLNFYLTGRSALDALIRAQIFAALKIGHNGAANGFSDEAAVEALVSDHGIDISEFPPDDVF